METTPLDQIQDISDFKLARFWKRCVAYLIDIIPIICLIAIIFYAIYGDDLIQRIDQANFALSRVAVRYTVFMLWMIYSLIMDSTEIQGTYGKQVMGLKVVNVRGEKIDFRQSAFRNLSKTLSYIPLGLGFFWIAIHPANQAWHDSIAQTYVIEA